MPSEATFRRALPRLDTDALDELDGQADGSLRLEQIADWSSGTGRVVLLGAGRATLELLDDAQAGAVDEIETGRRVPGTVRLAMGSQTARTSRAARHASILSRSF